MNAALVGLAAFQVSTEHPPLGNGHVYSAIQLVFEADTHDPQSLPYLCIWYYRCTRLSFVVDQTGAGVLSRALCALA